MIPCIILVIIHLTNVSQEKHLFAVTGRSEYTMDLYAVASLACLAFIYLDLNERYPGWYFVSDARRTVDRITETLIPARFLGKVVKAS